jgi:hypothetical protein
MNDLWSAQHAPNDDDGIWIRPLPREEPPRPSTPEDGVWVRPPVNPVPNYYYYNAGDDIVIVKIVPDIVKVANDAAADDTKVTTEVAMSDDIARPPVPDGYYYNPGDDEYDEIKMEIDRATANVDRLEIKAAADKDCVADADETIYKDCATDSEHTDETIYKDCVTDSEHADEESDEESAASIPTKNPTGSVIVPEIVPTRATAMIATGHVPGVARANALAAILTRIVRKLPTRLPTTTLPKLLTILPTLPNLPTTTKIPTTTSAPDDGIDEFCASYYNDKSHVPFIFKTFNAVRKFISSLRSTNK